MLSTAKSVFALVLLLLAIVFPAAAAADDMTSSSDNLAPTSTASSLPTSSASSEYTFTFPAYSSPQNFLVSYKDTIVVSWTSHKPNNPPYLQIQCWNRNSTTSPEWFSEEPNLTANLTTFTDSTTSSYPVSLVNYKNYNPCRFVLGDSLGTKSDHTYSAQSNDFEIFDHDKSDPKVWNVSTPAPLATGWPTVSAGNTMQTLSQGCLVWGLAFFGTAIAWLL